MLVSVLTERGDYVSQEIGDRDKIAKIAAFLDARNSHWERLEDQAPTPELKVKLRTGAQEASIEFRLGRDWIGRDWIGRDANPVGPVKPVIQSMSPGELGQFEEIIKAGVGAGMFQQKA